MMKRNDLSFIEKINFLFYYFILFFKNRISIENFNVKDFFIISCHFLYEKNFIQSNSNCVSKNA